MKAFVLDRKVDVSGVSGTGIVAQVIEFDNGKVVVAWLGPTRSIAFYDSLADAETVHCHGGASVLQPLSDLSSEIDTMTYTLAQGLKAMVEAEPRSGMAIIAALKERQAMLAILPTFLKPQAFMAEFHQAVAEELKRNS